MCVCVCVLFAYILEWSRTRYVVCRLNSTYLYGGKILRGDCEGEEDLSSMEGTGSQSQQVRDCVLIMAVNIQGAFLEF